MADYYDFMAVRGKLADACLAAGNHSIERILLKTHGHSHQCDVCVMYPLLTRVLFT